MSSSLSIEQIEQRAAAFDGCFTSLYEVIGDRCRFVSDDAITIALHVFARECGEWSARFRDLGPHRAGATPQAVPARADLAELLRKGFDRDETGTLVLYAITVEIIPPLLIALRDAAQLETTAAGGRLSARSSEAASFLVGTLHRVTDLLRSRSVSPELERFAAEARDFFHIEKDAEKLA